MLKELLQKLASDLKIDFGSLVKEEREGMLVTLSGQLEISLKEKEGALFFFSKIGAAPEERKEELFSFLMHANLLGQGTGGAALGWEEDENLLTLSLAIPYEINYTEFKQNVEEFANFTAYWKEELKQFKEETEKNIIK